MIDSSQLKSHLVGQICLIVEPSQAFANAVRNYFQSIERSVQILHSKNYADAAKKIEEFKPRVVVTEYEIEGNFGIGLIEKLQLINPDPLKVAILMTKNSDETVVAEAAEEQVDAFILKPFSTDTFRQKWEMVIERKLNPTVYMQKIKEGLSLLEKSQFPKALEFFDAAKKEHKQPALAYFHCGITYRKMHDPVRAKQSFKDGLSLQKMHYRCLVGLFELLIDDKNYQEAYTITPILFQNYPVPPKRLMQLCAATVFASRFEDLPLLYAKFLKLETRTEHLISVMSVGLFAGGSSFLKADKIGKAIDLFEKAVTVSGRSFTMITKVVNELLGSAQSKNFAQTFLKKADHSDQNTPIFNQLSFRVEQLTLSPEQLLERGRKLILSGDGTPEIFDFVIRLMVKADKRTLAETMIASALKTHPDLRAHLFSLLEENQRP